MKVFHTFYLTRLSLTITRVRSVVRISQRSSEPQIEGSKPSGSAVRCVQKKPPVGDAQSLVEYMSIPISFYK